MIPKACKDRLFFFPSPKAIEIEKGSQTLKVFRFFLLFCITSMLWFIYGCTDDLNPVGIGILPKKDFYPAKIDTFTFTYHDSQISRINTLASDRIMLGINQNDYSRKYEAWAFIKFTSWPDSLVGATITSAHIQLRSMYHLGADASKPLSFSIHPSTGNWLGDSLTFDSLLLNPTYYYETSEMLPRPPAVSCSDSDWIDIAITDTAILHRCFSTDDASLNTGILLEPKNTGLVRGFYSFFASDTNYRPKFIYSYYKASDSSSGTSTDSTGICRYLANCKPSWPSNSPFVFVQKGVSYRGSIGLDTFLLSGKDQIYQAVLEVTLNSDSSSQNFINNLIMVDRSTLTGTMIGEYNPASSSTTTININAHNYQLYQFQVTNFVKTWATGLTKPKFFLIGADEDLSFDTFVLYGTGQSIKPALRPRLIIKYSPQY